MLNSFTRVGIQIWNSVPLSLKKAQPIQFSKKDQEFQDILQFAPSYTAFLCNIISI